MGNGNEGLTSAKCRQVQARLPEKGYKNAGYFAVSGVLRQVGKIDFLSRLRPKPNRSPAKRVRFGKEEQRNERALTFEKSRSKRYAACSDVVREAGVEPARPCEHWHLKPASLPIPPLAHVALVQRKRDNTTLPPKCQHFLQNFSYLFSQGPSRKKTGFFSLPHIDRGGPCLLY